MPERVVGQAACGLALKVLKREPLSILSAKGAKRGVLAVLAVLAVLTSPGNA